MNFQEIKTVSEAKKLICELEKRIKEIDEDDKMVELWESGLHSRLSFREILDVGVGERYYLVAPKDYPNKGALIPIQIATVKEIRRGECIGYRLECVGISTNMKYLNKWTIINRPAFSYCAEVYVEPVEMVRLLEPSIFSNADKLLELEIYRME